MTMPISGAPSPFFVVTLFAASNDSAYLLPLVAADRGHLHAMIGNSQIGRLPWRL